MSLHQLAKLKEDLDTKRQEADRAEGALEQLMKKLKEDFDCDTLEQAETLLASLQAKAESKEQKFNKAYEKFMEQYGDRL